MKSDKRNSQAITYINIKSNSFIKIFANVYIVNLNLSNEGTQL